nr:hypothetical protein [Mycobacterium sp. E3298]
MKDIKFRIDAILSEQLDGLKVKPKAMAAKAHTDAVVMIKEAIITEYRNDSVCVQVLKHDVASEIGQKYWIESKYLVEV